MNTVGFVGVGRMARALISAMINGAILRPEQIICTDIQQEQLEQISDDFAVSITTDIQELFHRARIIILAFKPQNFSQAVAQLQDFVRDDHLIVSIMAGVRIEKIRAALPAKVLRLMPNTPCLVGEMASGLAAHNDVDAETLEEIRRLFSCAGVVKIVTEDDLDAVTGLSGSGPAFVARLIKHFIDAGIKAGLAPDVARELALNTFSGTAHLLAEWKMPPEELITMVSSPNGTTVAGREVLESSDVGKIIEATILRAAERSRELGQSS